MGENFASADGVQQVGFFGPVEVAQIDHWDDLPSDLMAHLTDVSQKIAKALKQTYTCTRVGMIIAGLEVPHTHIHILPVDHLSDFDFAVGVVQRGGDGFQQLSILIRP